mgnify:CR=1 FL=1
MRVGKNMDNSFIPKGMEIAKEAVIADNADEHEKALALYKQALNYFVTGLKYVKNEKTKSAVKEKVLQYMDRAEQLQGLVDAPKKSMVTATGGSASGGAGGTKKEDEKEVDPETAKLMGVRSCRA